jgi:hypothetical protein
MAIANVLLDNAEIIQDEFENLLHNFQYLDADKRMALSQELFHHLRDFLQLQKLLIHEAAKTNPAIQREFIPYQEAHQDILDMYQRLVLIHVDEPREEYKTRLETMKNTFQSFWDDEYQSFICGLQADLDPEMETAVIRNFRKLGSR